MSLLIISMKSCLFTFGREKNRMSRSQNFDSAGILRITLYRSCSVIFFMTRMRCLIVMAYGIINNKTKMYSCNTEELYYSNNIKTIVKFDLCTSKKRGF